MKTIRFAAAMALLAAPAFAEGDAANGEALFARQCVSCHIIADADGEVLAGRNARTGPNLYGVMGRQPGTYPDFDYGDDMVAYGEMGVVWEEEAMIAYLQGPNDFLREVTENRRARGKMAFQLRSEQDAADVTAYLATFSEAVEDGEMEETGEGSDS